MLELLGTLRISACVVSARHRVGVTFSTIANRIIIIFHLKRIVVIVISLRILVAMLLLCLRQINIWFVTCCAAPALLVLASSLFSHHPPATCSLLSNLFPRVPLLRARKNLAFFGLRANATNIVHTHTHTPKIAE